MRGVYFFVEGQTDRRFFEVIIKPLFKEKAELINIYPYQQKSKEKIEKFLHSLTKMGVDFLWVQDLDKSYKCIRDKIAEIENDSPNLSRGFILIVKMEIESWYFAGLSKECKRKLRFLDLKDKENITKEVFLALKPKKFTSKIDFYEEVLKHFDFNLAKKRNESFKYFVDKFLVSLLTKYGVENS